MKKKWSVFISGRGTNLKALIDKKTKPIDIGLVVTSNPSAPGVLYALEEKLPVYDFKGNWQNLHEKLQEKQITHIFLAGFMKILPAEFVLKWEGRILNLHPSLLPSYPGLQSIKRSYKDKADMGVTIHFVNDKIDDGKILLQEKVIKCEDVHKYTLDEAEKMIHDKEHELVCRAVELV